MKECDIFIGARDLKNTYDVGAYLERVCGHDKRLKQRVRRLLHSHQDAGSFLAAPLLHVEPSEVSSTMGDREEQPTSTAVDVEIWQGVPGYGLLADADLSDYLEPTDEPELLGRLGTYEITEQIGRGGMGVVLKAIDPRLNRTIALKVLSPELASNKTARKRFMREAQAAAAVNHENAVRIHSIDETRSLPYLVMEFISGCSLQERIDCSGPLEIEEVLRIAQQTALGLAAAHAHGLIHRDIKPANILLENGVERVKITDFGLARASDDLGMTRTGTLAGTPQYMSPEQAHGHSIDHRSDLFSLGCVMYIMCTGRPAFRGSTTLSVIRQVCDATPQSIKELRPDVPDWLVNIVDRLLEKSPDDRIQSASAVAELLAQRRPYLPDSSEPSLQLLPARGGTDEVRTNEAERSNIVSAAAPPRRGLWYAVAAAALVLMVIGVTEATGVTQLRQLMANVLRISTPEGTLVVESDDPNVVITVDGDDIVITGAVGGEIRLKPGSYWVRAKKNGQLLDQQLVTVTDGERRVVTITLESPQESPSGTASEPLVPHQSVTQLQELVRSTGHQYRAAFSPDGTRLLSTSFADDAALVSRVSDGEPLHELPGHIQSGVWTADGYIITGTHHESDARANELVVWDAATGKQLQTLTASSGVIQDLAVVADGNLVVSAHAQWWGDHKGRDNAVRVWDYKKGELLREIRGHEDQVMAVSFAPDGRTLVTGSRDRTVRLWDTSTGEELRQFKGTGTEVFSVAFSPCGKLVLAGYGPHPELGIHGRVIDDPQNCVAILWDAVTGAEVRRFTGHEGCINDVGFSPDGKFIVTASGGEHVGKPLPDGGAKTTQDRTVRVWNASTADLLVRIPHRTGVQSASFSPSGTLLATCEFKIVHIWELPKELLEQATLAEVSPAAATTVPRQLLISSNRGGDFDIYLIEEHGFGKVASPDKLVAINLTNHPAEDTGPAWSPDGERIAFCSSRSGNLDIWLMNADGSDLRQLTSYEGIDRTPCWSPDGERLAFVRHLPEENWEIFVMSADGTDEENLTDHPAREADPAWSPDGSTIAFSSQGDGTLLYLMNADGANARMLSARKGAFMFPTWSPDGARIVFTARDGDLGLGENLELFAIAPDGSDEQQLTKLGGLNTFAAWSHDGKRIAFQHRSPGVSGREAYVYTMNPDGTNAEAITNAEAHIGFGGGRPAWRPQIKVSDMK